MQPSIKYAVYLITGISLALLPGCSSLKGGTAGGKAADPPPRKGSTVPEVNATPEEIAKAEQPKEEKKAPKKESKKEAKAEPKKEAKEEKKAETAAPAGETFYAEEQHEGRLYIIGKTSSLLDFLRTKELPNSVTKPNKGPTGETVVLETDPNNPALEERLLKEFLKWNFYTAEEQHDGQTYVIGKLQSHLFFLQNKKLPSSVQVKIAGEPEKIVNFETEEGNPHLDARLKKEYAEKHGVKVE